jgi:ABC-type branched-subunit amino acid transport system substrate-binding protein
MPCMSFQFSFPFHHFLLPDPLYGRRLLSIFRHMTMSDLHVCPQIDILANFFVACPEIHPQLFHLLLFPLCNHCNVLLLFLLAMTTSAYLLDLNDPFLYPSFYRLIPGEFQMNPVVTMYKLAGVKKIVFWNEDDVFPKTIRDGVLNFAAYSGIQVTNITVPRNPTAAHITNLVSQIKNINPDGVIAAAYTDSCPKVIKELRAQNFVPKSNAQTDCVGDPYVAATLPDAIYGMDKTEYDRRMTGPSWTDDFWYPPVGGVSSAELVYNDMLANEMNTHWSIPITAAAGLVLHKAIERAGSLNTEDVRHQIALFNEPSFIGQIGFSSWGQNNVKDVIVLQADTNFKLQIVYPLGSATANMIYPAPTFDERVFKPVYMGKLSERVLAAVVGFFICISFGLCVFLVATRYNRMMIAASPLFLATILIGSIILYASYYSWLLESRIAACYVRFWLIGIGFVTMFGALFAKTWRIMRIFTTTDLRVFQITNINLIAVLSLLIGIEIVLLAIWSGTSRPTSTVRIADPLRPSKNQLVCVNGKSGKAMLGILVAYKLIIVLYGIYMSIRIWKIPLKQFNESRAIAFSMYNMLCFGLLAFGLQVSGVISDPAMFIVRSVCLVLSTFFTILAIFGPKILHVYTGKTGYSSSTAGSTTGKTNTTGLTSMGRSGPVRQANHTNKARSFDSSQQNGNGSTSHIAQEDTLEQTIVQLETELESYKKKYANLKRKYQKLRPGSEVNTDTV